MKTQIRYHIIAFFCCFWLVDLNSQAEVPARQFSSDSIPSPYQFEPLFVIESKLRNPFSVSSITPHQIKKLTEPSVEPLLNSVPGIWMQTGALNTNRISIRGVGYREPFATTGIKIYLNDIPLTNGVGETSIEDIHPAILSGIHVWRGPASAIWGSGLGGMIQLKSDIPTDDSWITNIQAGSYDRLQMDQQLTFRYGENKNLGSALHYQYLHDGGYRDNNDYIKHSFTWMQYWKPSADWVVNSFLHALSLKAYIPSSLQLSDFESNPSLAAPTWAAIRGNEDYTKWISGINFMHTHQQGWIYRGAVFGNFFSSDEVRPFNVLNEQSTSYGMRHHVSIPITASLHASVGTELFKENYAFSTFETLTGGQAGPLLTDELENRSYINAFLQSTWTPGLRWNVFAGMNAAISRLTGMDETSKLPVGIYPTTGVSYLMPGDISFSASISRGYSAVEFDDVLNSDGTINPNIKPETGWSTDVSYKHDRGSRGYQQLNIFLMHIKNTILTRRIMDDLFEKINGGSAKHFGVEYEVKWSNIKQTLSSQLSLTISDFRFAQFNDGGMDRSGNRLPGTPHTSYFLQLNANPVPRFSGSVQFIGISGLFLNDANSITSEAYQVAHANLHYELFKREKWMCTVSTKIHNIFDADYASMFQLNAPGNKPRYYYPGKPRSLYFNLTFQHHLD